MIVDEIDHLAMLGAQTLETGAQQFALALLLRDDSGLSLSSSIAARASSSISPSFFLRSSDQALLRAIANSQVETSERPSKAAGLRQRSTNTSLTTSSAAPSSRTS